MPALTALTNSLAEGLFQVQNQPLLRSIIDHLSEGVVIADAEGTLVYFNPAARVLQGPGQERQEEWARYYQLLDADSGEAIPLERQVLAVALRGEEAVPQEVLVLTPDLPEGRHLRVSAQALRGPRGNVMGAILFARDIGRERRALAEQRRALAEQRRAESRYRLIVEAVQEGLWMLDVEGYTTYANGYLAAMIGHTVEEMLGRHALSFFAEEHHALVREKLELRRFGHKKVHDLPLRHKQGQTVWVQLSSNPLRDEAGRSLGSLASVTDITRRREAEQRALQLNEDLERRISERTAQLTFSNQELEAFAYSVAHDLRTPLRGISSFIRALDEDCPDQLDRTGQDYLRRIHASSQRMAALIDGLLELSRVNRTGLKPTQVSLSRLAQAIAEQLQRSQPGRSVRWHIQEDLVDRGDAQLLGAMLENLLGNAWKFTRDQPEAEIEFGARTTESGQRVYFVHDNGAGFDMEYRAKLFGVFERLHTQQEFEGTGVGLATVQRIIRRHAGRVWGEGRVGEGATFSFTLHEPPRPP
jgi:PAS domain S-box-containing protein